MQNDDQERVLTIQTPRGSEPIAVLQRSIGEHPFVAWHGLTAVNRFWFWDILWPYGTVWLAGLPGHGNLPRQPRQHITHWSPDHFIDVGIQTLRTLTDGRPATLIGHSTGGMVALGIAQRAPELVSRLILIAPVVWANLTGIVGMWQACARSPRLLEALLYANLGPGRLSYTIFKQSMRAFIADPIGLYRNPHTEIALRAGYTPMRQTQIQAYVGTIRVLRQADLRPAIIQAPPHVPALIIHGERDPIIPIAQAHWLAAHLPQAKMAAIANSGHLPYAEHEPFVNQIILDWLASHQVA